MKKTKVAVVGSINMDLVTEVSEMPELGETRFGQNFSMLPGGKGANQAVACSRLGADVSMIGCVGNDDLGQNLLTNLKNEDINTDKVEPVIHTDTGTASIVVERGDNRIVVVPGANSSLTPEKVRKSESTIQEADVLLIQLEVPLEAVTTSVTIANRYNVPVILNPAPALKLTSELIQGTTFLTPNEHELAIMLGRRLDDDQSFKDILTEHPGKIVMTKGSEGAYYTTTDGELKKQQAFSVEAIDSTGAGDTFNAGLAVMIGQGYKMEEAVRFAICAGTLSVTKSGAQAGMPKRKEVEDWLSGSGSIDSY